MGQLAQRAAHTLPCLTSWHLHFPSSVFFFFFHPIFQLLLILLPLGKVSFTANGPWSGFVSIQLPFLVSVDIVHGLDLWMI